MGCKDKQFDCKVEAQKNDPCPQGAKGDVNETVEQRTGGEVTIHEDQLEQEDILDIACIDFLNRFCEQLDNHPVGFECISDSHHYDDQLYHRCRYHSDIEKTRLSYH